MELVHPECASIPHPCFTDKMRLWRSGEGSLAAHIPADWKGPSVALRQKQALADAKRQGITDPIPAHDKYRWT